MRKCLTTNGTDPEFADEACKQARAALSGDGSTVADVVDKATILTKTLLAIHEDARYHAVWICANNHIGPYAGPTYTNEMAALVEALDQLQES